MYRSIKIVPALAIALLGFTLSLNAQDEESQSSLLPNIDPQDIEIKSEFRARFPGLRRQPILGFQPERDIYQVDPDRQPFVESQQQRMADLPVVDLDRPDPPTMKLFDYPHTNTVWTEAGFGSYRSPEGNIHTRHGLGSNNAVAAHLGHHSSGGHLPANRGAFRHLDGGLNYVSNVSKEGRLQLSAEGFHNFNSLFSIGDFAGRNTYRGAAGGFEYSHLTSAVEGWKIAGNYTVTEATTSSEGFRFNRIEHNVDSRFNYQWAGKRTHELFEAYTEVEWDYVGPGNDKAFNWYDIGGGVTYKRLFDYKTHLKIDAEFHGVSGKSKQVSFYPTPTIELRHWIRDYFKFTAVFESGVKNVPFYKRYRENPFTTTAVSRFKHSFNMGGRVEGAYNLFERSVITLGASYHNYNNYLYYRRPAGSFVPGTAIFQYYQGYYNDASIAKVYASVTQTLATDVFWLNVRGYVQQNNMEHGQFDEIPYLEQYGLKGIFYIKPSDQLMVEGWGAFKGPRFSPALSEKLNPYLLLGGRVELQLSSGIGFYGKILNILDQDYQVWHGYPERPLQIYGGFTFAL